MTDTEATALTEPSKGVRYSLLALKLVELCIIILCIGLIDDPAANSHPRIFIHPRTAYLCYATFGAFLISNAVTLLMRLLFGDICPWKTSALLSFIAAILFFACACTLLLDWSTIKERHYWPPNTQRLDFVCAAGFITLITSILYIIEFIITLCFGIREQLD